MKSGDTLGPYRVLDSLGAGGMGEVYLAEDSRLGRRVAIKVLPADVAASGPSLARLEQEARLLAQLEHPNVATVYGLEEARPAGGGAPIRHLVMQLAEGEPLSHRIADGALPVDEAIEIGRQVAAGVGAAHDKGIIHRDLKPANVMVADGPGGRPLVKVLDFGLAKALEGEREGKARDLTTSPTVAAATEAGVIMGTAAYMSPEQARGKPVDRRTDVWAFGCLLYEVFTGRPAFGGETVSDIIAAILTKEPDWSALPTTLPVSAERALRRCLARDADRRPYDVRDVMLEMAAAGELRTFGHTAESKPASAGAGWAAFAALLALAAFAGYTTAGLFGSGETRETTGRPAIPTRHTQVTFHDGAEAFPSISADGDWIVYASRIDGDWDVYLQAVDGDNAINLTEDSPADDWMPAMSPDGRQIAFRSERGDGGIFVMGRTGESVRRLTDFGHNPAWSPDGTSIVVTDEMIADTPYARESVSAMAIVDASSGEVSRLATGDAVQASFSPDGRWLVYWGVGTGDTGQRDLWVVPVDGGDPIPLLDDTATDWTPVFTPDGTAVVFSSDRGGAPGLWRIALDPATREPLGAPELVVPGTSRWAAYPAFAANTGQLLYASMDADMRTYRLQLDETLRNVVDGPRPLTSGSRHALSPDISPDGEWIAYATGQGQQEDIYLQRIDGSATRRLTDDPFKDRSPRFSPDGRTLAFYAARDGDYQIWAIDIDGSNLRSLTEGLGRTFNYATWSPAGDRLVVTTGISGRTAGFLELSPEGLSLTDLPVDPPGEMTLNVTGWAPDGIQLVADLVSAAGGRANGAIVIDPRTGESRRISDRGANHTWLDNRHVIGSTQDALWVTDTASGEQWRVLTIFPDRFVEYMSPLRDARGVVYSARRQQDDLWLAEWE